MKLSWNTVRDVSLLTAKYFSHVTGSRDTGPSHQTCTNQSSSEASMNRVSMLPPISQIDMGVIESLPPDLFSEVNEMYNGKLSEFMHRSKKNVGRKSSSGCTLGDAAEGVFFFPFSLFRSVVVLFPEKN